jgi:hypothetical protein
MATARSGSTGVALVKGDLYVVDANLELERLPVGVDGRRLTARAAAALGVAWEDAGAGRAIVFLGGASMGAGDTGKNFGAQDTSNGGKNAVLSSDNQMSCGFAGFIDMLTWNSSAANTTTVFRVKKNGVVVATVTLTGLTGGLTFPSVAVAVGDQIAVEYNTGLAPGRTTTQVWGKL